MKSKASCQKKGAKASKVSQDGKVHCTAAQKAACAKACEKSKASAKVEKPAATNVRLVKNEQ